ncbi:GTPase [Salirhabdus salicampi]|uniref:GTPase n=1 Tax=Salirhabdus salicampi TaxID=476102 RepID=UPI0020C1BE14|nr:GTPase [Salirhabdus salicampi]MCP8616374.1 50S ribosome-binding GTPase [Salirhabdus salicampi]
MVKHKNQMNTSNKHIKNLISIKNRQLLKYRMRNHFHALQEEINNTIKKINSQVNHESAKLVHPMLQDLTALSFKIKELTEGLDKKFELFIVGMGNYGKSTLINALLEQNVADMDVRPKTWKVDVYDATLNDGNCLIVYENGETDYKSIEETKHFIDEEEQKTKLSRRTVKAELKKVLPELKTKEAIKETEEYLKKEFLYQSNVVEVRWPIKTNYLSQKFMVVDTPGLVQENLSGETIVSVQKYYHKADGVIWILDATKLAAKKSKDMIDELEKSLKKIGGKTDNIITVLNRIDLVRRNGGKEAENKVLTEANNVFGKHFKNFICISAKQALDSITNNDGQQKKESGIEKLIQAINANFYENAQKIQLQSREVGIKQILHNATDNSFPLKLYLNRLRDEQQKYNDRKESILSKYNTVRKSYKNNLKDIIDTFLQNTEIRINNHAQVLFELETDHERENYIKNYLFCLEELQPELENFHKYWINEIESLMKQLVYEVVFTEYQYIDTDSLNKMFEDIDKVSQSNLSYKLNSTTLETDDLSFVSGAGFAAIGGLIFGPIGLLLAGLTSALGINKGIAKLFKSGGLKRDLNKAINTHVKDVKNSILEDLDLKKEKAKDNVLKDLNNSFINLHGSFESSIEIEKSLSNLYEAFEKPLVYPDIKTILVNDKQKIGKLRCKNG